MIVTLKPIKERVERQWLSDYFKPIYKGCKHSISSFYDKHGTMITGLTEKDAKDLGEKIDKDLRNTSSFWHDFRVILTGKDLTLNLDNAEDLLKYKLLMVHPLVAKSTGELNPKAQYVIYDEVEEAKSLNSVASTKVKAYVLYEKLTLEQKKDILRLYKGFIKTDSVSAEVIEARLFEQLEQDPAKFVKIVEDKKRDMKVFLRDLVSNHILRKNKNAYYYGEDALGHDEESTISHLDDPANQSLKIVLMQELETKNK